MKKKKKEKSKGFIVYKNYLGQQSSEEAAWKIFRTYMQGMGFNNGTDKFGY